MTKEQQIEELEFDLKHSQHQTETLENEISEIGNKMSYLHERLEIVRAAHTAELIKRGEIYKKLEYLKE